MVTVATLATAVTGTAARARARARARLATTTAPPPRDETRGATPPHQAVVVVRRRRPVHQGTRCTWESTSCSRRLGKETLPKSNLPDTCLQDKRLAQLCIQFVYHGSGFTMYVPNLLVQTLIGIDCVCEIVGPWCQVRLWCIYIAALRQEHHVPSTWNAWEIAFFMEKPKCIHIILLCRMCICFPSKQLMTVPVQGHSIHSCGCSQFSVVLVSPLPPPSPCHSPCHTYIGGHQDHWQDTTQPRKSAKGTAIFREGIILGQLLLNPGVQISGPQILYISHIDCVIFMPQGPI